MSQAVRHAGFKVALVGTGGDELFGGYTSFPRSASVIAMVEACQGNSRLAYRALGAAFVVNVAAIKEIISQQTRWAKLPDMVRHSDDLLYLYQLAYALFLPAFQRTLLGVGTERIIADGLPLPCDRACCPDVLAVRVVGSQCGGTAPLPWRAVIAGSGCDQHGGFNRGALAIGGPGAV